MTRRIAFYAPLKPPGHPSPSGDREMARQLMALLREMGHEVGLVSDLRTYLRDPDDTAGVRSMLEAAKQERGRIADAWRAGGAPDLWVTYHPYYKSPDLLGPALCRDAGVPWITIEASHSVRRAIGHWTGLQERAWEAVTGARVNVALTGRDAAGLAQADPETRVARLAPFIDAAPFLEIAPAPVANRLVTVAMMREGDKLRSYEVLAGALRGLTDLDWTLTVVGDGPARPAVEALFDGWSEGRISWTGELDRAGVAKILSHAAVFVWPGCGEAYGLAYLEAQAAGLPVAALAVAGVPEVVRHEETGLLAADGDVPELAASIRRLLTDAGLRGTLASAARQHVMLRHTRGVAADRLGEILERHVWSGR